MKIAIDGPAGSGKSTVARLLAEYLNIPLLETGKVYRAVGYCLLREGVDPQKASEEGLLKALEKLQVSLNPQGTEVKLKGERLEAELREEEVGRYASIIARIKPFREAINRMFREVSGDNVVAEGRDAGTAIFPDADVKIYLTASPRERAIRRLRQLGEEESPYNVERLTRLIEERDKRDMEREANPLKPAEDAVILDTTGKGLEEVFEEVKKIVRRGLDEKPA